MTDIILDTGVKNVELSLEERALMDEIEMKPSSSVEKKRPAFQRKPMRRPEGMMMRPPPEQEMDGLFNPSKSVVPEMDEGPGVWDGGEPEEDDEYDGPGGGGGGEPMMNPNQLPSEGYKTIEDEKADLLNKLARLQKKGFQVSGRLNTYSSIEEIRTEYKRITYQIETDQSVKFQRRILMACVTGLEFLNNRYDPFDVQLDGWSDDMMRNVDEYDTVFEELHAKYKNKVAMAPEVKLIMMVGGSAMMFHLTNSMFKSQLPNMTNVMKQNPEIMKNMMEAVSKAQQSQPVNLNEQRPPTPVDASGRREMKGPGVDLSSLFGGFMAPPTPANTRTVAPRVESIPDDISDIVSDAGGETKEISLSTSDKKGSRKKKVTLQL
jgi:hypothetical protein